MAKIALIQDWLTGFGGGEQVLLAFHKLYPEAPIFTSLWNPEGVPQFAGATVIPSYLQKLPYLKKHHQIAIPLMPVAFESFDLKEYDILLSVGGGLSKGVIAHPGQRHISYCHTPIRYCWNFGGDNRAGGSLIRRSAAHYLRMWDVLSARRVDRFLANSQTVADRIKTIYRAESEVVYPPISVDRFQLNEGKREGYLLSVGRLVDYKRTDLIIKACLATKMPLKISGKGPEKKKLQALAEGAPWIEFIGRVPDSEINELYGKARAFVFAAEEDFGIVPVEAMATGTPVVAYGKGGLTETVIEGKTGHLFGEQNEKSLATALSEMSEKWDHAAIRQHALGFGTDVFNEKIKRIIASET